MHIVAAVYALSISHSIVSYSHKSLWYKVSSHINQSSHRTESADAIGLASRTAYYVYVFASIYLLTPQNRSFTQVQSVKRSPVTTCTTLSQVGWVVFVGDVNFTYVTA